MSLFPAYSNEGASTTTDHQDVAMRMHEVESMEVSPAREEQLLASDEEAMSPAPAPPPPPPPKLSEDFYLDSKIDYGNLRVSTLYYPGRPQYTRGGPASPLGRARKRSKRYFEVTETEPERLDEELAARVSAFRRMLADQPHDLDLWLQFIRFQERCGSLGAALEAARSAAATNPCSTALRAAHHRLAALHLPSDDYLALLRDAIAAERSVSLRSELWIRLLDAIACSPSACSLQAVTAAASAATRDTGNYAPAYPHLVLAVGSFFRAAGLWELLVMLIELVATMNFPPTTIFPPPEDETAMAAVEARLLRIEDETAASRMPLNCRWTRVERARATAHWRAPDALPDAALAADPQRLPRALELADLLRPLLGSHAAGALLANLLRLAKIPLLPGGAYVRAAFSFGSIPAVDGCGEALLPLLRAARRLPPSHPARAPHIARARLCALHIDPPHHIDDGAGFVSWTHALWAACCGWSAGARRVALLCWRLRWLHALCVLADPQEARGQTELRRLRGVARKALRDHSDGSPLPFMQFARIEQLAGAPGGAGGAGGPGGAGGAGAVARRACRAALRDRALPHEQRLYVARVDHEIHSGDSGGLWAVVCSVLERELPPDEDLETAPPAGLLEQARDVTEDKCSLLEMSFGSDADTDESEPGSLVLAALLPGAGEWASARAQLATCARRHQLYLQLKARTLPVDLCWEGRRYYEQAACALGAPYAARLAQLFPDNAYLALARSGVSATASAALPSEPAAPTRWQSETAALADLLCTMLRSHSAAESEQSETAAAVSRAQAQQARRIAAAGGGGALGWGCALEACARAGTRDLQPRRVLHSAATHYPQHKWLLVRGAAWGGEGCGAPELADLLLERQLRLHALPQELDDTPDTPDTQDTPDRHDTRDTQTDAS